ncbi:DNA mismatch repair enzyme MutH, partial [mine drainage metagenome]
MARGRLGGPLVPIAMTPAGGKYDPGDPASILRFARTARGRTVRELCDLTGTPFPPGKVESWPAKGFLGNVVERFFGIERNNRPEPDFPEAGVELKVLPLMRRTKGLDVKEPTSLTMIDYMRLVHEQWDQPASVRKKLDRILFVFVVVEPKDLLASKVREAILWRPREMENATFREDWERTRDMVERGEAHLLSEVQARALAARRKGPGGATEKGRRQPGNPSVLAPSRAWALKTRFTRQILQEHVLRKSYDSAYDHLQREDRGTGPASWEAGILRRL